MLCKIVFTNNVIYDGAFSHLVPALVAQTEKNLPACSSPGFSPWIGKIPWRREWLPTPVFLGFSGGSESKESACNAGDLGLIPGLGRFP